MSLVSDVKETTRSRKTVSARTIVPLSWRKWVARHQVASAILAGIVATHMATVIGFWMPAVGLPQLDWNSTNGAVYTPYGSALVRFVSGGFFHYVDGIVFVIIFALTIHPKLPWRNTELGNLAKGLFLGTVLTIISCAFMIPYVYFPQLHPGFFSINLGWNVIFAVFLWHCVFGLHLGLIYNPVPADELEEAVASPSAVL